MHVTGIKEIRLVAMSGRSRRLAGCLLPWLACAGVPLSFLHWPGPVQRNGRELRTVMGVREKLGSLSRKTIAPNTADVDAQAKALTSKIKGAGSVDVLIRLVDEEVNSPVFNCIHAGAVYHSLAQFKQKMGSLPVACAGSPALLKLNGRLKGFIKEIKIGPRQFANVLWAAAYLLDAIPGMTQLFPAIVAAFPVLARRMNAFDVSNCMWASAQLKDELPDDVVKIISPLAAKIPYVADDLTPQELSNCLWATAQLKDVALDDVVKSMPALAAKIPGKADSMKPQELANCFWQRRN